MLKIRQASVNDVDTIFELIYAIAQYHNQEQYVLTNKEELINSGFSSNPKFGVILAEIDNEIAGYLSYTINYSIWSGSNFMNIDDVFIWDKYRGKNIGKELMGKSQVISKSLGIKKIKWEVEKDNHGAIKFYTKLGAKITIKGVCSWSF